MLSFLLLSLLLAAPISCDIRARAREYMSNVNSKDNVNNLALRLKYKMEVGEDREMEMLYKDMREHFRFRNSKLEKILKSFTGSNRDLYQYLQQQDVQMESSLLAYDLITDPTLGKINGTLQLLNNAWERVFKPTYFYEFHIRLACYVHTGGRKGRNTDEKIYREKRSAQTNDFNSDQRYHETKAKLISRFENKSDEEKEQLIKILINIQDLTSKDLKDFYAREQSKNRTFIEYSCPMYGAYEASNFTRQSITDFVEGMNYDFQRIRQFTEAHATYIFPEYPDLVDSEMKDVNIKLGWLEAAVHNYISAFYTNDWPDRSLYYTLEELIANDTSTITSDNFYKTALVVQDEFGKRGSASKGYHVLVTSHLSPTEFFIHTLDPISHANLTLRGVDIHVFRYDREGYANRTMNGEEWLREKRLKMEDLIRSVNPNTAEATFKLLRDSFGPLCDSIGFRSVIILRKNAIFKENAVIHVESTDGVGTANKLEVVDNTPMFNNRHWRIVFFV